MKDNIAPEQEKSVILKKTQTKQLAFSRKGIEIINGDTGENKSHREVITANIVNHII